jgi:hypothetical protein
VNCIQNNLNIIFFYLEMSDLLKSGFYTGTSATFGMLCGNLLLENIKMEKQRTNKTYPEVFKIFKMQGTKGLFSGLYPWGIITGYTKGFGIGTTSHVFNNVVPESNYKKPLIGVSVGVCEAMMVSPLLLLRNHTNKNLVSNQHISSFTLISNLIKTNGILSLWKGSHIFAVRRGLDWGSRFYAIQIIKDLEVYKRNETPTLNVMTTFIASSSTVLITTPIDRLLPTLYTEKKSVVDIIKYVKSKGIISMYSGTLIRGINTGFVTCWVLLFPKVIDMLIG